MARVLEPAKVDHMINLYLKGVKTKQIIKQIKLGSTKIIYRYLRLRGIPFARRNIVVPVDFIKRYANGASLKSLADELCISRRTLERRLKLNNIPVRGRSEAERLKWASMTDEQRRRQVDAAHEAARGRKVPLRERRMRAQTRFEKQRLIGPHERAFAKLLDAAGIKYRQQLPCGVYNLDFALTKYRVAVEIQMGSGDAHARANRGKRIKYVLNQWHLFEVRKTGTGRGIPISPKVVEELIAFAKLTRLNHPPPGQHRVIRPDGYALGTCPKVYRSRSKNGGYHLVHRTVGSDGRPL